jgi:hypothetical protein
MADTDVVRRDDIRDAPDTATLHPEPCEASDSESAFLKTSGNWVEGSEACRIASIVLFK